jgi:hypothetical protein
MHAERAEQPQDGTGVRRERRKNVLTNGEVAPMERRGASIGVSKRKG